VAPKLALIALQIVAVVAVFLWTGAPGASFAGVLAMGAWRYFLWEDRD
jgi:hypothetical protein